LNSLLFLITGSLKLYGVSPTSTATLLVQPIVSGSNRLFVRSSFGWKIDDLISFSTNSTDYEAVYIQNFNSDGSITVAPNFKYSYPASNATLVSHLTRNIKIISDFTTNLGFSIVVTSSNQTINPPGNIFLNAV
jgi:hypothetical protein